MSVLVDLYSQVQGRLPARFGGTGNPRGWAVDGFIAPYPNGTGATITRGSLVQLALNTHIGGGLASDNRIKRTTTANQQNVLGVVVGRFRMTQPVMDFEDVDAADGDIAAVLIAGVATVEVEGTVELGYYVYSAATDGKVRGSSLVEIGALGIFESRDSAGWARVRLWGTAGAQGQPETLYSALEGELGDGTSVIPVNTLGDMEIPFDCDIYQATLVASVGSGSLIVDVRTATFGAFATFGSIVGATPPWIVSGIKVQDTALVDWTKPLTRGSILRFKVTSCSGIQQATLSLAVTKRRP